MTETDCAYSHCFAEWLGNQSGGLNWPLFLVGNFEPMRVIVCGAAGFLGSHLCDVLLDAGHEVTGVDSLLTGSQRQNLDHLANHPGFTFVRQDISQAWSFEGPLDAILNLASPASPKDFESLQLDILRVHSQGMWHVLEIARQKQARFLLASSSEIYGVPENHPQMESYAGNVNPVGDRSCYNESKRFAEALVMAYHRQYGLSTRIARIFNTYGPRMRLDDGRAIPNFITGALRGEKLTLYGDGTQTRSPCYVTDTVRGLQLLLESNEIMPVNIGNPDEWTMLDLAGFINGQLGNKAGLRFGPALHLDDPPRRKPDIARAKEILGWRPEVGLADGISRTAAWMQSEMKETQNGTG